MKIEGNLNAVAETGRVEVSKNQEKKEKQERVETEVKESEPILTEEKRKTIEEFLQKSLKEKNPNLEVHFTERKYEVHDATNRIMVTVTDSSTDKVLLEIPEEKLLDVVAGIWELAGLMIDERR